MSLILADPCIAQGMPLSYELLNRCVLYHAMHMLLVCCVVCLCCLSCLSRVYVLVVLGGADEFANCGLASER